MAPSISPNTTSVEKQFLQRNQLPDSYLDSANRWFSPLVREIEQLAASAQSTVIIGINGTQGSGKSTLADYLCTVLEECISEERKLRTVSLSLDDFYMTRAERQSLASEVHPLFKTRGVPGTHDIALTLKTIDSLMDSATETMVPRFDKTTDDRYPETQCDLVSGKVDVIIFEGWCVGCKAQPEESLLQPVNSLERDQDPQGIWRSYFNRALASDYQALFNRLDKLIMLRAPSFNTVFNWRLEQEQKLIARLGETGGDRSGIMSKEQIAEFIAHYQRITEYSLEEMPSRTDHLFQLDDQRQIVEYRSQK